MGFGRWRRKGRRHRRRLRNLSWPGMIGIRSGFTPKGGSDLHDWGPLGDHQCLEASWLSHVGLGAVGSLFYISVRPMGCCSRECEYGVHSVCSGVARPSRNSIVAPSPRYPVVEGSRPPAPSLERELLPAEIPSSRSEGCVEISILIHKRVDMGRTASPAVVGWVTGQQMAFRGRRPGLAAQGGKPYEAWSKERQRGQTLASKIFRSRHIN